MSDLDKLIADAKAEEQAKADFNTTTKANFRKIARDTATVTIKADEYVLLKQKETDLERVLSAIIDGLGLSYNKEYLTIRNGDLVVNAVKVLYPESYDKLLALELEKEGE